MNLDKVRGIDLVSIFKKAGYKPQRETASRAMYYSPLRSETIPSLIVYKKTNTWYDWGTGESGDGIDFIMKINGSSFIESVNWILGDESLPKHDYKPDVDAKRDGIDILNVEDRINDRLVDYAKSRAVSSDILHFHCDQVEYSYPSWDHIIHIAIGFRNIKGGWELRNPNQKVSNAPKSWSFIRGSDDLLSDQVNVFEGFFDFLSHLTLNGMDWPRIGTYILNSTVFIPMLTDEFSKFSQVHLYLDNDHAANQKIEEYLTGDKFIDHRDEYRNYGDYNDFAISRY